MAENTKPRPKVSTTVAALLLGGAVVIVAGVGAYVSGILDPWIGTPPAAVTEQTDPDAAKPSSAAAPERTAEAEPAAEEPADRDDRLPAFELLRVESDGSTVIAGRAAGAAQVEVLAGETLIARAVAGTGGDFAIVLDDPLKPGDYEITLRATDPAGTVSRSSATAIISVPETPEGQVLALIERPGQASEIMVAPEPGKTAELAVPAETAPVAAAPDAAAPADAVATAEEKPAEVAAVDPAATVPADGIAVPAVNEPVPGTTAPLVAVEAVEIEGPKVFVAGAADPGYTVRVYANDIHLGDAKSSTQGRFLIEATRNLPVGDYIIRADVLGPAAEVLSRAAVPFEREPGDSIAAVAPGVASAVPGGEDAAPVVAAATEEPAPNVAAVSPEPSPSTTQAAEVAGTMTAVPAPAGDAPPAIASSEPAQTQAASEAVAAASAPAAPAVEAQANEQAASIAATTPPASSGEAIAGTETQTAEPSAVVAGETARAATASEAEGPAMAADTLPAAEAPAETASAASAAAAAEPAVPVESQADTAAAEPEITQPAEVAAAEPLQAAAPPATAEPGMTQPKLQSVTRSVIIRKGDSLWKISRRAYGQGIRYSTLYLANRDQIQDPSKIWVGQVFTVPALAE